MILSQYSRQMPQQKMGNPTPTRKAAESKPPSVDSENYSPELYRQRHLNAANSLLTPQNIQSNPSYSLDKISTRTLEIAKTALFSPQKRKQMVKFPPLRSTNPNPEYPEEESPTHKQNKTASDSNVYYQGSLLRCLRKHQTTYLMNLYRQHFYQCVEVLRFGKTIKIPNPRKHINLHQKNPALKTVFLDMDQTLIHCDENSHQYTVKLNFPLEKGGQLAAGVRVRPYCKEFLQKLSHFAEIIIFTASSASYADVVLNYLDPEKKYISHRLYRQHCTLEKGFYLKDLRVVNRKLQNVVLVDNSPYCHILQPQNGIPIVPFYHFSKDRQLQNLLPFLRRVVEAEDCRKVVMETFFWDKYLQETTEPRRLFLRCFGKEKDRN